MVQEVSKKVLWIFVFLILAAIAVLGVILIRDYQSHKSVTFTEQSPSPQASSTNTSGLTITITEPTQDIATTNPRLTLSGVVSREAIVVITGGTEPIIAQSEADGNFSTSIQLVEGLNNLTIEAVTEEGVKATTQRHVVLTKGSL